MKTHEETFNDHCVKVMGYTKGEEYHNKNTYYNERNVPVCRVDEYDPYNNIAQTEPVIDSLISSLGLRLNTGLVQRSGILVASRSLIFENMLEPEEDKEQIQKIQQFNAFCAKTMGWHQGTGKHTNGYFLDTGGLFGTYKGLVEDYNPYDNMEQMQPVMNVLAKEGLAVYPQEAIDKGPMQAGRDNISKFMPPVIPKLGENWWDEYVRNMNEGIVVDGQTYNAEAIGILKEQVAAGVRQVEACIDELDTKDDMINAMIEGFNLRNRIKFDTFDVAGYDWSLIVNRIKMSEDDDCGWGEYDRKMDEAVDVSNDWGDNGVAQIMWDNLMGRTEPDDTKSKTVPEALNKLADAIDAYPPPITNFAYGMDYPTVTEEQGKFNFLCREIMFEHARSQGGDLMLPQEYDPYYDATETINVFEIVLQYVPGDVRLLITGRAEEDDPTDINVLIRMQDFIRTYGTDEYMLPPAVAFNKMCRALVEGYNIEGCIVGEIDPWNHIEDLAPILPFVIEAVGRDLVIPNIVFDREAGYESHSRDIHDNMRWYIQCYGQTALDLLDIEP